MLRLPRMSASASIVGGDGRPVSSFQIWWESVVRAIEMAFANIETVNARQDQLISDLEDAVEAIQRAQAAAEAAAQAAQMASQEAAMAQAAAEQAQAAASGNSEYATQLEERIRRLEEGTQEP